MENLGAFLVVLALACAVLFLMIAALHYVVIALALLGLILLPGIIVGMVQGWRDERKAENSNPTP